MKSKTASRHASALDHEPPIGDAKTYTDRGRSAVNLHEIAHVRAPALKKQSVMCLTIAQTIRDTLHGHGSAARQGSTGDPKRAGTPLGLSRTLSSLTSDTSANLSALEHELLSVLASLTDSEDDFEEDEDD